MGVDCKIYLPANVRIRDVAKVIGVVTGCAIHHRNLSSYDGDGWYVDVPAVELDRSSMVTLASVYIRRKTIDGADDHYVLYHFEGSGGRRLMMPRSTAFWIAVGVRLVTFFGGSIDFQDCDDVDADLHVDPKSDAMNCPEDGVEWQNLQERIAALKPITEEEWRSFDEFAAYKIKDMK